MIVKFAVKHCTFFSMKAQLEKSGVEVTTMPIGNGWRVRIFDGRHLQFVSGFNTKRDAEDWIRKSSQLWLSNLDTLVDRL